jgi:SAM-dependent methyltransferase
VGDPAVGLLGVCHGLLMTDIVFYKPALKIASMQRVTEPELMDDQAQSEAYAAADFAEAHSRIVDTFGRCFPGEEIAGHILDLGCGPGDICFRFAARYPGCSVTGVDGSGAMIRLANARKAREPVTGDRVHFTEGLLPGASLTGAPFAAVISNSLLHHLHEPQVLWETVLKVASPGTRVYVVDLFRPETVAGAQELVDEYAAGEPDILRRDFYNSLCAAFEPHEVVSQLATAGLAGLAVDVISDRHLAVHGVMD